MKKKMTCACRTIPRIKRSPICTQAPGCIWITMEIKNLILGSIISNWYKKKQKKLSENNVDPEGEKKILFCFVYSRCERWGRGKDAVFPEQIEKSYLPIERVENTRKQKLRSIISQVKNYLIEN